MSLTTENVIRAMETSKALRNAVSKISEFTFDPKAQYSRDEQLLMYGWLMGFNTAVDLGRN